MQILVWANCREEFCRVVDQCLTTLELRFVEAEDVEPLRGKPKFFAARARLNGGSVQIIPWSELRSQLTRETDER